MTTRGILTFCYIVVPVIALLSRLISVYVGGAL